MASDKEKTQQDLEKAWDEYFESTTGSAHMKDTEFAEDWPEPQLCTFGESTTGKCKIDV